jgi:hypothetical protein
LIIQKVKGAIAMSDDYRSMVTILKRLPSTYAELLRARIRGDENLPSVNPKELQASLDKLPESDLATIARVLQAADARNAEADIARSWDDECDAIELEIDAGEHDDLAEVEEQLARSVGRLTHELDREASWMKAVNDIYDEPSELVFDTDDDDDSLEDGDE